MVDVRPVGDTAFADVVAMHHDRIDDRDPAVLADWYDTHPDLFLGAFESESLVGFALGRARTATSVELVGISVDDEHQRRGIGSRLLTRFEGAAADLGYDRVSVGSAGGYVDEFYLANGYRPESILVRTTRDARPDGYRDRFDVLRERDDDGTRKVYVDPDGYDPGQVAAVRAFFDDPEAIYIMEKSL